MATLRVITSDFEIYDKLSRLKFLNSIEFDDNSSNRRKLNKIISNINSRDLNIEAKILNNFIVISKRKDFDMNIYFRTI